MTKKKNIPNNIHDKTFYDLMSNRPFATEIYKKYITSDIVAKIDFSTMDMINLTFRTT